MEARGRKLALAFLIGLLPCLAGALTLSEIRTEARTMALDTGTTRRRFSDTRLNAFINEAQRQTVTESRPILRSTQIELVVGTTFYSLPSDFLQVNRVTLDYDTLYELTPEANDKTSRWETTASEPTHYFINFSSRTKIGFYPWPDSVSSTGTVRVEYFAQTTDMSADSDQPYNAITELIPYHYGLAYFAAARMSAVDGKVGLATLYFAEFRATIDRMKSEAKSRPSYRPGAIGRTQ
jgi:hypothetical protein